MSQDCDNSTNLSPSLFEKNYIQENKKPSGLLSQKSSSEEKASSSRQLISRPRIESKVVHSFKKPVPKLKKFTAEKRSRRKSQVQRKVLITQPLSLVVSLRYGKLNRTCKSRKLPVKLKKICEAKKIKILQKEKLWEKRTETPKKGKRGRLGGKAKAKPPVEESITKNESDEESESFYFYKISLGQFQQPEDGSGASTSNKQEDFKEPFDLLTPKESNDFEEKELLELQSWGMSSNF